MGGLGNDKMNYGDGEHRKMLEQSFVALLDNETDRQKEWVRLRKNCMVLIQHLKRFFLLK